MMSDNLARNLTLDHNEDNANNSNNADNVVKANGVDKQFQASARVYRPRTFAQLVGQDVLVKTLTNAIKAGRVPHAMIFTGTRGVGKTTTARIIARSLNCVGPDGNGHETIDPCGVCEHCRAILSDSHMDVIEMDAASRTSIDDIREIIESARYKAISARYKVYIIDEVHMLSKSAFNGLLKTLEEPPSHVKFIFATTEINKVPNTILSRCMRFDLQRVEVPILIEHFRSIASKQGVKIDDESLALIAKVADGSVRDGMSILDQAIVISDGDIVYDKVADMLGIADKRQVFDLFLGLVSGKVNDSLEKIDIIYSSGVAPSSVISELADFVHVVTAAKITKDFLSGSIYTEDEKKTINELAEKLSIPELSRYWQMLLRGHDDLKIAINQHASLRMLIIRLSYISDKPTPDKILDLIKDKELQVNPTASENDNSFGSKKKISNYSDVLNIISSYRSSDAYFVGLYEAMVHFVAIDINKKELSLRFERAIDQKDFTRKLINLLKLFTAEDWHIKNSHDAGEPSLLEQRRLNKKMVFDGIKCDPLVVEILENFPESEIIEVE